VIPGLTETSLAPQAAEAAGIDFDGLIARIVELAGAPAGAARSPA
jgi:D-alanine-D-alanine ligase